MLSKTVEYALRAVAHLAQNAPAQRTTVQVAKATRVPMPYLRKVLQLLGKGGIVSLARGIGGGAMLAMSPEELSILDVVNAVEPIPRIRTCPLGLKAHGVRLCPLHARLDRALASMEAAFAATTLAEILAEPSDSQPLCEINVRSKRNGDLRCKQ